MHMYGDRQPDRETGRERERQGMKARRKKRQASTRGVDPLRRKEEERIKESKCFLSFFRL